MRRRGEEAGWKRKPCFSLLRLWMNHVPTTAIRFSSLRAAGAELKGQVVTFLRVREKGRGGWGREGPAPKKGGSKKEEWSFFFFFFPSSPLFPLLSLDIFN